MLAPVSEREGKVLKDILFTVLGYVGVIAIILCLIYLVLELLNRLFKIGKYIIMYHQYKRNEELYDMRNCVIIGRNGDIRYSCVKGIEEKKKILKKAINDIEELEKLREKYSIKESEGI